MIPFTNIFLRADGRWEFHWELTGTPAYYRIVLWGVVLDYLLPNQFGGNIDGWNDIIGGIDSWNDITGTDIWNDTFIVIYVSSIPNYPVFPPPLEIAYESKLVISEIYKPYMFLQWYNEICSSYKVELLSQDGLVWSTVKTMQEVGEWVNEYQTPKLEDETTYIYRVFAEDSLGDDSQPERYTEFINCPPDPPNAIITYASPNIVISPSI